MLLVKNSIWTRETQHW